MDHTARLTIPDLELAVGPYEAASVRLMAPAKVDVEYVYERGYPALPTFANGDPGEPGMPDEFDFKRIITLHPLDLVSSDNSLHLVVCAGSDIYSLLTIAELATLEDQVLADLRDDADQVRVDSLIAHRELAVLLGGRP